MPAIHEQPFQVRHYECDAYGHVNHANYLRYMQEAAIQASAAVGYDTAWYHSHQRQWLIRETDISYQRPLTYLDAFTIRTWVADFHRARSRRAYEFRHATTGEIIAEAQTDWVYLDTAQGLPLTVPEDMIQAFVPEGLAENRAIREPFPTAPPPPPGLFTVRRRVEWRDIDMAQHVNNAAYMAYMEDCGVQVAAAHHWPMARMTAAGFGIVARRYRIDYKRPALLDQELEIATYISDVKRSSATRHYAITRVEDGALLTRAQAVWVWVSLETGRPIRVPDDFVADFADNIAPAAVAG